jgi:hypothetical protein
MYVDPDADYRRKWENNTIYMYVKTGTSTSTIGENKRLWSSGTVTGGCSVFTCYHIEIVKRIYWLCLACILLVYSSYGKSCGKTYKAFVNIYIYIYILSIYDTYNVCAACPTSQGSVFLRKVLIKYSPQVPDDLISVNHGASPRTISESPIILYNMIQSSSLHDGEIANLASCSKRTVTRVCADMRAFGTPCAPKVTSRQRSHILPHVLEALLNRLLLKPDLYSDEVAMKRADRPDDQKCKGCT